MKFNWLEKDPNGWNPSLDKCGTNQISCNIIFSAFDVIIKPIFHLATLFARREAKTRIRQRDWLKLAGEKIRRDKVGSVPTFLCVFRQVENRLKKSLFKKLL